jgi:hypothetical protein
MQESTECTTSPQVQQLDVSELLRKLNQRDIVRHVHILPKQGIIYVSIPKVASTTLKSTFLRLAAGDTEYTPETSVHQAIRDGALQNPEDFGFERFMSTINNPRYKRIAFVRNPYVRILSCYLNKFRFDKTHEKTKKFKKKAGLSVDVDLDFSTFVQAVANQRPKKMNDHWRVQTRSLLWKHISYDFVGRMEEFSAEIGRLSALLDIDLTRYVLLKQGTKTRSQELLHEFYTPQLQELVYSTYKKDFRAFGYSSELPA